MKSKLVLFGFLLVISASLNATIIHIPEDQPTIQLGLNSANSGDTVLVSQGIYYENIIWPEVNGIILLSESGAEQTIIDGNNVANTIKLEYYLIDTTTVIDGFTICNGNATGTFGGGGIYAHANPIIQNCIIENNTAPTMGGGGGIFHNLGGKAIIRYNIIRNNSTEEEGEVGGGIYLCVSQADIYGNIIYDNYAEFGGGGIGCYSTDNHFIKNNQIYNNSSGQGSGIRFHETLICLVEDNEIHHNLANEIGGGIFFTNSAYLEIIGNQIHHNESLENGGGIGVPYGESAYQTIIHQNDIFLNSAEGNGAGIYYELANDTLNAENNWWGDASGPYNEQLNPNGTGNEVYGDVDFIPWATEPFFPYQGPVWHIATWGNDVTGDGSADNPFATIQHGIDVSTDGDTVLVSEGTYYENIIWPDVNGIVLLSELGAENTIIDGNNVSNTIILQFYSQIDTTTVIDGFTICNGNATDTFGGGGIYAYGSDPVIQNCIIENNTSSNVGGGILHHWASRAVIRYNIIRNNSAEKGGGIGLVVSQADVEGNEIYDNIATCSGGGISCYTTFDHSISNNEIYNNSCSGWGGGGISCSETGVLLDGNNIHHNIANAGGAIRIAAVGMEIINSLIHHNVTSGCGAGIHCYNSGLDLVNVTLSENTATGNSGGIYCSASNPSLVNCILWNDLPEEICVYSGTVTATYSDIQDGWTGIGNIDADPLFADPQNGDFHLTWANFPIPDSTMSPCIDTGDPNSPLDPDSTRADMGAYYFDQNQQGVEDTPILPARCLLYQNYPNPFYTSATISFLATRLRSASPRQAKIEIYNIKGQFVRTLYPMTNDQCQMTNIVWDGKDNNGKPVGSSIYFYRLKMGDKVIDTKKCLLLK
ncbi:MAG: right-handed parallel beta-helix repeat-containing protein [Candidatus Cloacimonetes bacterium]|nr:right-handed parallel beta-helix repeat-containing protein [Candidatus Cloacimonadota bacterium]